MTAIVGSQCVGLEENGPVMKGGQPQNYIPPQSLVQSSRHRMPCLAGSSPQGCSCRKNPRPVCSASYHLVERSRKHRSHKAEMGQHYNLDWSEHLSRDERNESSPSPVIRSRCCVPCLTEGDRVRSTKAFTPSLSTRLNQKLYCCWIGSDGRVSKRYSSETN